MGLGEALKYKLKCLWVISCTEFKTQFTMISIFFVFFFFFLHLFPLSWQRWSVIGVEERVAFKAENLQAVSWQNWVQMGGMSSFEFQFLL